MKLTIVIPKLTIVIPNLSLINHYNRRGILAVKLAVAMPFLTAIGPNYGRTVITMT
jgi:hypothetical protein